MSVKESAFLQQVEELIYSTGWAKADVLKYEPVYFNQRLLRVDTVLTYNLYPLAVVEAVRDMAEIEAVKEQVLLYAEAVQAPYAFIISGTSITEVNTHSGEATSIEKLPSPKELWSHLGREDVGDPRVYPPCRTDIHNIRLFQARAISRAVEAAVNGQKHIAVCMIPGTGKTYVGFQIAWKLIKSGYFRRMALLDESLLIAHQTQLRYEPFGGDRLLLPQINRADLHHITESEHPVHIGLTNELVHPKDDPVYLKFPTDFYDLIFIQNLGPTGLTRLARLADHFSAATIIAFSDRAPLRSEEADFFGRPVYQYSVEEAVASERRQPPEGYYEVQLNDIAEVRTGIAARRKELSKALVASGTNLIIARNIHTDGTLSLDDKARGEIDDDSEENQRLTIKEQYLVQPGDILLASMGTKSKVAIVPDGFSERAVFSSSVIRIRVQPDAAEPKAVFEFLRSDIGQLALRRLIRGVGQPFISSRDVGQMIIFLPKSEETEVKPAELSAVAGALRQIKDDIVPHLEKAEQSGGTAAGGQDLNLVAALLRSIASSLVPPTLAEKVMADYPTPIALAYRRFHDARFNVYEQVLRLRDLYEAVSFFIYNIMLADAFHNLDPQKYYIKEKGARRAYNHYSMASRLDFVETVLEIARDNKVEELFIPELVESSFVEQARKLQSDFRNALSHTATATESRARSILDEFRPVVEDILGKLEFLTEYKLVRIPAFYIKQGFLVRRMEVYTGAVPELDEQTMPDKLVNTRAEHDHLVLLDSEDNILDCYPLYQLLATEETRYETHLCFFKQRKVEEKRLEGESVQGAFQVTLEGFEEFEALQKKIINEPKS